MNPKEYLTNRAFCPLAWTGIYVDANGDVRNCIRKTKHNLGNLRDNSIHEILNGKKIINIKENMSQGIKDPSCECCYSLENNKNSYDIISDRIFYLKEMKNVDMSTYDDVTRFDLRKIDIRWSNSCNFACVYCGPLYSNKWAKEIDAPIKILDSQDEKLIEVKNYILENIEQIEHAYFAGGEPLLMKQNEEILQELLKRNPDVNLRINTNLSKTGTPVFDLICQFKNVHWILSTETMADEFEYIRHGGKWQDFLDNLEIIKGLDHKVSFNMLWFILNPWSLFDTVEYLQNQGFQNNSYIIGPVTDPEWQDIRNLNQATLDSLMKELVRRIEENPGYLLEDSYRNLLTHLQKPFQPNRKLTIDNLEKMDNRRNQNSQTLFAEVYKCLQD